MAHEAQHEDRTPAAEPPAPRPTPREIVEVPAPLRSVTFDQVRTLASLWATLSPARTAADLQREQSSIQKQLATLNAHFRELCGEPLAHSEARRDLRFYPTGERF